MVDDTTVVGPYTAPGTHDREIVGADPIGPTTEFRAIVRSRVEDSKRREGTGMWNAVALLQRIGAHPESLTN